MPADDLWLSVLSLDNLARAWERVHGNHGCAGVDRVTVEQFHRHRDRAIAKLRSALATERYRPLPLRTFHIPKPSGGYRTLGVPAVRDRLAQQAVVQVIGPLLESTFEPRSYAYRLGRSIFQAITRVRALHTAGYAYALDADIDGFFDHVDHNRLLSRLRPLVADAAILALVRDWLRTPALEGDELHPRPEGLPQGAVISPLLANVYLDPLDEALTNAGYQAVRYADDFMVFCLTRAEAERAREFATEQLTALGLRLEPEKTRVTSFEEGFEYLGARFRGRDCVLPQVGPQGYGDATGRREADAREVFRPDPKPLAGWRDNWREGLLPLSSLCPWAHCPRSAYLRLACGIGVETGDMIAGRAAHRSAYPPEDFADVAMRRDVPVCSARLGVQGEVDLVAEKWGLAIPIEIKWSLSGKVEDGALLQLVAEAICLEETWDIPVPCGEILLLPKRERVPVDIDDGLRQRTADACASLARCLAEPVPPPGLPDRCPGCSLHTVCLWQETEALRTNLLGSIGAVEF